MYFDSLTLRHPRPALYISQENHYYPFGLALGGAAANTVPAEAISKAQYNGGSLLEDELLDAGEAESANYATPYRRYDPTIGRLLGVDPLADKYADQGTANFAGNDPVNQNDPTGAFISDTDPNARGYGGGRSLSANAFARADAFFDNAREIKEAKENFLKNNTVVAEVIRSPIFESISLAANGNGKLEVLAYGIDNNRLQVDIGYRGPANAEFFQTAITNQPIDGKPVNEPFIDSENEPGSARYPLFFGESHKKEGEGLLGYNAFFRDAPNRQEPQNGFYFMAETSLITRNTAGIYEPIITLIWGFKYINNLYKVEPMREVLPSKSHTDFLKLR